MSFATQPALSAKRSKLQRIAGIDGWRAGLLLLGVFVHAATNGTWTQWIVVASSKFRMEAFFGISGVLSYYSLHKNAPVSQRLRLVQLGVPFLFGLLVVNEFLLLGAYALSGDSAQLMHAFHPPLLHLWFLPVLILCNATLFVVEQASRHNQGHPRLRRLVKALVEDISVLRTVFKFGALGFCLLQLPNGGFWFSDLEARHLVIKRLAADSGWTLLSWPYYMLFFGWGVAIGHRRALYGAVCLRWQPAAAVVVAGAAVLAIQYYWTGDGIFDHQARGFWFSPEHLFNNMTKAFIAPAAFMLIMSNALHIRRAVPAIRRIASSAYTIYIVHLLTILLARTVVLGLVSNFTISYFVIVLIASVIAYAIHRQGVERSWLLALLLNGRSRAATQRNAAVILANAGEPSS